MPSKKKQTLTEMNKYLAQKLDERKQDFSVGLVEDLVDETPMFPAKIEPVDALQYLNRVAKVTEEYEKALGIEEGNLVDLLRRSFEHTLWI